MKHVLYLLGELYTLVNGECPSLLDEDRGGDASLDAKIARALLLKGTREQKPHKHDIANYDVCKICGLTPAAIEGCHHCDDSESVKNGRCWWCLQPVAYPSPQQAPSAQEPK